MRTCSCGNTVEGAGMLCARCAALQTLELDAGATEKQIKDAYRVLVKVWHPDRFSGDPRVKEAADEKLKALNSAYLFLTSKRGQRQSRRPAQPGAPPAARAQEQQEPRRRRRFRFPTGAVLKLGVLACVLLVAWLVLAAMDSALASDPATGRIYSELRAEVKGHLRQGVAELWSEAGDRVHAWIPKMGDSASQSPGDAPPAPVNLRPYITAGLTQQEVIAVLGAPTSSSEGDLVYGASELVFSKGKLSGWDIAASSPIRAKLWPVAPVNPNLKSFTVGSTKNEVLVVQGTPSYFSDAMFGYGGSVVYFVNDRVVSWKNDPTTVPLRVSAR